MSTFKRPRVEDDGALTIADKNNPGRSNFLLDDNDDDDDLANANKRQRFNTAITADDSSTTITNTIDVSTLNSLTAAVPHYTKPIKPLDPNDFGLANDFDNDNDDEQFGNEIDDEDNKNIKAKVVNKTTMVDKEAMFELMMAKQGVFLSKNDTTTDYTVELTEAVDIDDLTTMQNLALKKKVQDLRNTSTTTHMTTLHDQNQQQSEYSHRMAEFHRKLDEDAITGKFMSHADNSDDDRDDDHEAGDYSRTSSLSRFNKKQQQQPQEEKKATPQELVKSFTDLIQALTAFEVAVGDDLNMVYKLYMKKPNENQLLTVDFVLTRLNTLLTSLQAEIAKDTQVPVVGSTPTMIDDVTTTPAAPVMIDPRNRAKKNVRSKPAPGTVAPIVQKNPPIPYDLLRVELLKLKDTISIIINASVTLLQIFEAGAGSLTCDELHQWLFRYQSNLRQ